MKNTALAIKIVILTCFCITTQLQSAAMGKTEKEVHAGKIDIPKVLATSRSALIAKAKEHAKHETPYTRSTLKVDINHNLKILSLLEDWVNTQRHATLFNSDRLDFLCLHYRHINGVDLPCERIATKLLYASLELGLITIDDITSSGKWIIGKNILCSAMRLQGTANPAWWKKHMVSANPDQEEHKSKTWCSYLASPEGILYDPRPKTIEDWVNEIRLDHKVLIHLGAHHYHLEVAFNALEDTLDGMDKLAIAQKKFALLPQYTAAIGRYGITLL